MTLGVILVAVALSAPPEASGQPASLLADIGRDGHSFPYRGPSDLLTAGGRLYFLADAEGAGSEVWTSDGTSAGTEILRDACPGECSYATTFLGELGGLLLWREDVDDGRGDQLWRTDGTRPGTFQLNGVVADLRLHGVGSESGAFFGGSYYFSTCGSEPSAGDFCDLWRTAGTDATTGPFHLDVEEIGWLRPASSRLYYLVDDQGGWELWSAQLDAPVPFRLHRFPEGVVGRPHTPVVAAGRLFFFVRDSTGEELWTSDGTVGGTRAVTHFAPESPFASWVQAEGSLLYFSADDGRHGREIWRSDGTTAGTVRLTDFGSPTPFDDRNAQSFAVLGDKVFYLAREGRGEDVPFQIWNTRGTPRVTSPLALACPQCEPAQTRPLVKAGGRVFIRLLRDFEADLWSSDGTAAGTRRVLPQCAEDACTFRDILPWTGGALLQVERGSGFELWFSDGTAAGTQQRLRLERDEWFGNPPPVTELAGRLFFLIEDESSSALWVREAGGRRRPVRVVARSQPASSPRELVSLGSRLFFYAREGDLNDFSLWTSTGTTETTTRLDLPGVDLGVGPALYPTGNLAFFETGVVPPVSLWRTDGTAAGTFVIAHLQERGIVVPFRAGLVVFDGGWIRRSDGTVAGTVKTGDLPADVLYVVRAVEGANGVFFQAATILGQSSSSTEVWVTDGTTTGTRRLTQFNDESTLWRSEFAALGSYVYFSGLSGIFRSDGTVAGTEKVVPFEAPEEAFGLLPFRGHLYFFRQGDQSPQELGLWRADGTLAGTSRVGTFRRPDFSDPVPRLTALGDRLYFAADDGIHGLELWSTDGTRAGTAMVRDILPGSTGSSPASLVAAGASLYFAAGDTVHGIELWRSDGTEAGTRLVQDIAPQAGSSAPSDLTVAGDNLYFAADDGLHGQEPWVLALAGGSLCRAGSMRLCLGNGRYTVESTWRDRQGNEWVGHPVALTADTGYFWFFDPSNVEVVLKVLDGRGVNGHVWTFYGALSDVEYSLTVTDKETGLAHRYLNPPGQLASVADTRSFGPLGANLAAPAVTTKAAASSPLVLTDRRVVARAATGACAPSSDRLCLNGGRYSVEVAWKDFSGNTGTGQGVGLTADTGYFWFFNAANVELVLKVLDGSAFNGHRWVFYGALSSVEYTVTVTDTETGEIKTYRNPSGNLASVADIEAF